MRWSILTMLTTLASLACAGGPASTEGEARVAAAAAFQREYDRSLHADETSVLTAVAAYYLAGRAEAEPLEFELGDARLRLHAGPDALVVSIDEHEHTLGDAQVVPVDQAGRWRLGISRQDQDWRVLVHDSDAEARAEFTGIAWFPITAEAIVDADFEPLEVREPKRLQTSRGVTKTLYLAGVYQFELAGRSRVLQAFAYAEAPSADEILLIPFRDRTTGVTSYGAGRYLEPSAGETRLDFNRATNPLCAYSEHYNCPMPPAFNQLDVEIIAGARAPEPSH